MKKQLLAAASIASVAFAGLAFAAPAQAVQCGPGILYVNTVDHLLQYDDKGVEIPGSSVALTGAAPYGDIALSLDHTTVYGVYNFDAWPDNIDPSTGDPNGNVITVVDPLTGNETSTITITGAAAGVGGWVGAAILPTGELIIGSGSNAKIYKVNVSTGASTEWADMSTVDPSITGNMGDFAMLPDGDEIAIGADSSSSDAPLIRIHPDGSMTQAGRIPQAWGAGRVGDSIMVAGNEMDTFKISDIPASGTATIPSTQLNTFSDAYGAAGTQDGETGTCDPTLPNTGVNAGALGALATGLGLAGAASVLIARRKRA